MRRVSNVAIASVTVVALCSGAWLLRSGAEPHPLPSPPRHRRRRPGTARGPSPPRCRTPRRTASASPRSAWTPPDGARPHSAGQPERAARGEEESGRLVRGRDHPGERGTAVVAGHVDNADGPAVFYDLGALRKGGTVEVDRLDGSTALFTVDAVEVYDSRAFPDAKVYGAARRPELRVITCGGGYSETTGYQGNVVVFAHLTGSR